MTQAAPPPLEPDPLPEEALAVLRSSDDVQSKLEMLMAMDYFSGVREDEWEFLACMMSILEESRGSRG